MKTSDNTNKSVIKKILLISYHFPPSDAIGGLRIAKFAQYLPEFNWIPSVLTIKDHYIQNTDIERLKEIKKFKVYKTIKFPTLLDLYLKLKTIILSILVKKRITLDELTSSYIKSNLNPSGSEKILQKLRRYVASMFFTLPDTEIGWIFPGVTRAIREMRNEKFDCILTSGPPQSVHLIGLLIKLITGVKWIADFRDPWTSVNGKSLYPNCALSIKIECWLEKQVVQRANLITTTTDILSSTFKFFYTKEPHKKFICISNGFDEKTISLFRNKEKYKKFTLSYTGTLYLGRTPEPIFKALNELERDYKINIKNITIKLVGNCHYVDGKPISEIIDTYNLHSSVEVVKPVSYLKSLEIIKRSHIALLFAPDQPLQIPAKVFDYIGLGTKILALCEEGATLDLIKSTNSGKAFYFSDTKGIKEFIYQMISNQESVNIETNSKIISKYSRNSLTRDLVNQLENI